MCTCAFLGFRVFPMDRLDGEERDINFKLKTHKEERNMLTQCMAWTEQKAKYNRGREKESERQ